MSIKPPFYRARTREGALPFTVVMVLMCTSLIKALYRDGLRDRRAAAEHPAE